MAEGPSVEKLRGARAKLDRAEQHLLALDHGLRAFVERRPFRLLEELGRLPGEDVTECRYLVSDLREPPLSLSVHVGEVVHDLHSSLDHLAWAVAEQPWRRTQFPVFLTRDTWGENAEAITRSVPDRFVAVMEAAQPYHAKSPNAHPLALLNHLWNADKHRLLPTTVAALDGPPPSFRAERDVAVVRDVRVHVGPLQNGTELARVVLEATGPSPAAAIEGRFPLGIVFRDGSKRGRPLDGREVVAVLAELRVYAEDLYERFAAEC
jgi:hypothetical protein